MDLNRKFCKEWNEMERRRIAISMELPEDSTWKDIGHKQADAERRRMATSMELPEDSTWKDIVAIFSKPPPGKK